MTTDVHRPLPHLLVRRELAHLENSLQVLSSIKNVSRAVQDAPVVAHLGVQLHGDAPSAGGLVHIVAGGGPDGLEVLQHVEKVAEMLPAREAEMVRGFPAYFRFPDLHTAHFGGYFTEVLGTFLFSP